MVSWFSFCQQWNMYKMLELHDRWVCERSGCGCRSVHRKVMESAKLPTVASPEEVVTEGEPVSPVAPLVRRTSQVYAAFHPSLHTNFHFSFIFTFEEG